MSIEKIEFEDSAKARFHSEALTENYLDALYDHHPERAVHNFVPRSKLLARIQELENGRPPFSPPPPTPSPPPPQPQLPTIEDADEARKSRDLKQRMEKLCDMISALETENRKLREELGIAVDVFGRPAAGVIFGATAAAYGVMVADLVGPSRLPEMVKVRHIACYLTRHVSKKPYAEIGKYCGGRDHTTIYHACKTVKDRLHTDAKLRTEIAELTRQLELAR